MKGIIIGAVVVIVLIIIAVVGVLVSKQRAAAAAAALLEAQGQWRCVPGYNTPVRYVNGDVQCLSTDGTNCMNGGDAAGCAAMLSQMPSSVNPLSCGADHLAKWGSVGYDNPAHWCSVAKSGILGTSA